MNEELDIKLSTAVRAWWREAVARHGWLATLRRFMAELVSLLRDSTPERRRRRYGDVDYDWDKRVDTTGATLSFRERLLGVFHSPYQPTEPALFHEMLAALKVDLSGFTFIDLGSGKGRTLLMASDYPFARILGVELLPRLHEVAVANIGKYTSETQKCFRIESVCVDAGEFSFPVEPLVLYLFNPFPEWVLGLVLENLKRSLQEHPRPVYVLYHNPLLKHDVEGQFFLRRTRGTSQYEVYVCDPPASAGQPEKA